MNERTQFNFALRWEIEAGSGKQPVRRKLSVVVRIIAVFFAVIILASPWVWQQKLALDLERIEASIQSYNEVAAVMAENDRLRSLITDQRSFLELGTKGSISNPAVVRSQIGGFLPGDTQVTSFLLQVDNTVQLQLILPESVNIRSLENIFINSGRFDSFDIQTISLNDRGQTLNLALKLKP